MSAKKKDWFCGVALLAGIAGSHLLGQGATSTVLGTVTDMSGAFIPDAKVQVRNIGTGSTQSTASDNQGRFRVSDLGVGDYELEASKQGFSTLVRKGVTLTIGSQVVIDFAMPVGPQQQTVTVEGQASQVETTSAAVSSLTDQKQMRDLPLNGRNMEQLIQLAPGVVTIQGNAFTANGFGGRAAGYSIAGSRPEGQAQQPAPAAGAAPETQPGPGTVKY